MWKRLFIAALVLLVHAPVYAQRITHAAIGSGAVRAADAGGSGTVSLAGQAVIGVIRSAGTTGRVGFLYVATGAGGPTVVTEIDDVALIAGGDPFVIEDLNTVFSDPGDDPLLFSASSSDVGVAAAVVSGSMLTVMAEDVGTATITVTAVDGKGGVASVSFDVDVPTTVAVERSDDVPQAFALEQNYPNPFNPQTTIAFDLPEAAHVTLTVYNVVGRVVATLESGTLPTGRYAATWDATGFASGLYMYRLQAGSYAATRRMLLMR